MSRRRGGNRVFRLGSISALALLGLVLLVSISDSVNATSPFVAPVIEATPATVVNGGSSTLTTISPFSGGTSPYTCQWLRAAPEVQGLGPWGSWGGSFSCTIASLPTISTGALSGIGTWSFLLQVTDSSPTPTRQTVNSAPVNVTVNYLGATLTLLPSAIDKGQTTTVTANITWSGGTSPYSITLYSGTSSSACSADTTGAMPPKTVNVKSVVFNFTAPPSQRYYCAAVTDSTPRTAKTPAIQFIVNQGLQVKVNPNAPNIDSDQTANMTAVPSGGTSPYHYHWYTGSSCSSTSALSGATSSFYLTEVLTSEGSYPYSVNVTDSSTATPAASYCAPVIVTVNPALAASISPASPTIDSGQSVRLNTLTSFGTSPYLYQWYTGSTCARGHTISGQKSSSYQASPTSTISYSVKVTDTITGASSTAVCASAAVTVNPALSVPALSIPAIDQNQTATVTANVTWHGGTSPYSATLYSGTSSTCSSDTTKVAVLPGSNPQTGIARTSAAFTFTAQAGNEYCASVTDGLLTPSTKTSATVGFIVNGPLTVLISYTPKSIAIGSNITLAAVPSGGTSPYHYQWYTGSSCSNTSALSGATSISYKTKVPASAPQYSVLVTDSSVGTPRTSICKSVTVTVVPGLIPVSITVSCTNPRTHEPTVSVVVGSAITCTALGSTTSTGAVDWSSNSSGKFSSTSCSLSKGRCLTKFTPTAAGSVGLTATYSGDSKHAASTGGFSLTVIRKTSKTTVYCAPASVAAGSSKTIKCTAKVKGYNTPTGNVTWSSAGTGAISLSAGTTCTLTRGSCYVVFTGTSTGTVTIQATYDGDSNNTGDSGTRNLMIK